MTEKTDTRPNYGKLEREPVRSALIADLASGAYGVCELGTKYGVTLKSVQVFRDRHAAEIMALTEPVEAALAAQSFLAVRGNRLDVLDHELDRLHANRRRLADRFGDLDELTDPDLLVKATNADTQISLAVQRVVMNAAALVGEIGSGAESAVQPDYVTLEVRLGPRPETAISETGETETAEAAG